MSIEQPRRRIASCGALLVAIVLVAYPSAALSDAVTIPQGTPIYLVTDEIVTIDSHDVGSRVALTVENDLIIDGKVVIEANSQATAKVSKASGPGMVGAPGEVGFLVQTVTAVDGSAVEVYGSMFQKGKSRFRESVATAIFFGIGLLIKGGEAEISPGTTVVAKTVGESVVDYSG